MFSVFQDIHTYLALSFVLMLVFVFKFFYKKLDKQLENEVNQVRQSVENIEVSKKDISREIRGLQLELQNANEHMAKSIKDAENKARELAESSNKDVENAIERKQREYNAALAQIRSGLSVELKNKMVGFVLEDLKNKLRSKQDSRDFQNFLIQNSIKSIESLTRK